VDALIEPLALVILPHREAVGELFEARRLLEPAIGALAARRATPEDIAEMRRILEDQAKEIAQGRTGLCRTPPSTRPWPPAPTTAPSAASTAR
jgi:DNA-binding FadR family transcriptional regulator